VGNPEGQVRLEESRTASQESSYSETDEPGCPQEASGSDEGALGGAEEGWRYDSVAPKLGQGECQLKALR
jgi:hypothetical protein